MLLQVAFGALRLGKLIQYMPYPVVSGYLSGVGLIPASGVGILLAILLFVREQIGGAVVRRKLAGNQSFSKRVRPRQEMEILVARGDCAAICELQGSLFFGTPTSSTRRWSQNSRRATT